MTVEFERMLVGLPQSGLDVAAMNATAQLAEILGLRLTAMLVEDQSLIDVATLPGVREFRPLGGGWHPIEIQQLAHQFEYAGAVARRVIEQAVRGARIDLSFSVSKGSFADVIGSVATDRDIIVIIEPRNPAERVTHQFNQLVDVAFKAAAAVMIVPGRTARTGGPIIAVASDVKDFSIRVAIAIAAAIKERVIIIGPVHDEARAAIAALGQAADVRCEFLASAQRRSCVQDLLSSYGNLRERLIVSSRGFIGDDVVSTIAAQRGSPFLLLEPRRDTDLSRVPG